MICKYCHNEVFEDYDFCSQQCRDEYIENIPLKIVGRVIMSLGIFMMIIGGNIPSFMAFFGGFCLGMIILNDFQEYFYYQQNKKEES